MPENAPTFRALVIDQIDGARDVCLRQFANNALMEGDTLVRVSHSSLNYKDGLALTGRAPVVRRFPMIPGIDMAGEVVETSNLSLKPGDRVILNGWGTGETHLGGLGEMSRVPGSWLIPQPEGFSPAEAMAIGTAGYTAALCVLALEAGGFTSDKGPVLVTGAAGGVGSVAVSLLAASGFHVIAATGRPEETEYLKSLGAAEILPREELSKPGKPLGKERWAGAVDVVGSVTLANVLAMTKYGGIVAACGLAGGMDLPASVAPFILRNVTLAGVDSVMAPREKRLAAWDLLDRKLDRKRLADLTTEITLDEAEAVAAEILDGRIRGRVVVKIV